MDTSMHNKMRNKVKPASHWPIIKESERTQSVVWSDKIFSDYFPMIVSILLPDHRTKSHSGNRKLPPIVGPKCDMADCRRLPPIIIPPPPPMLVLSAPAFSSDFLSDPLISWAMGRRLKRNNSNAHTQYKDLAEKRLTFYDTICCSGED